MSAIVRPKIPLLTVFSGLWAGMPLRLVPQSPDTEPRISAAPVPTGRQSRVPGVPAISAPGSRTATPDTTGGGATCGTPRTHGDQRGPSARTGVTTPPAAAWTRAVLPDQHAGRGPAADPGGQTGMTALPGPGAAPALGAGYRAGRRHLGRHDRAGAAPPAPGAGAELISREQSPRDGWSSTG